MYTSSIILFLSEPKKSISLW